jgi:hypothetical protein
MRSILSKWAIFTTVVLVVLCCWGGTVEAAATVGCESAATKEVRSEAAGVCAAKAKVEEGQCKAEKAGSGDEVKKSAEDEIMGPPMPVIVAEIGDHAITYEELEEKLVSELRSYSGEAGKRPDANTVLMEMLGEKAMITAGMEENYLEEDKLYIRFYERNLVSILVEKELEGKIKVTDSEIAAKMKADSRLDRERAKKVLERSKSGPLVNKFYSELLKKLNVEKLRYNFPRAGQIHQRLLYRPKKERKGYWIKHSQIDEELTDEEKGLVLVRFTGGKVTLFDWFMALNETSPPNRPKDLNTIEGVERLLERAMKMPIFIGEAKLRGIDKDESFVRRVRQKGDDRLLDIVKRKVSAGRARPTKEEIAAYFNNHKEEFRSPDTLRIDQIWCAGLETAEKVKAELAGKGDFESVKQKYSLNKEEKAFESSARREGIFFADIWKGEPNEVLGPVKGFYREGVRRQIKWQIKWRVVKILAKKAGKIREYSSGLEREAKGRIRREREGVLLSNYRKELLEKYAPKIYRARIKDIDPFDIG